MQTLEQQYAELKERRSAKHLHKWLHHWDRVPDKEEERKARIRAWVIARADGYCQSPADCPPKQHGFCMIRSNQAGAAFHVHHIKPLLKGGSNHVYNLAWLCPNCHALVDDNSHDGMRLGVIKKNGLPTNWWDFVWNFS